MIPFADSLPLLVPGCLVVLVVAVFGSRTVARLLGVERLVAGVMLLTAGVILVATLTPLACACVAPGPPTCDMTRVGFPSLPELIGQPDVVANVLLFVPLGFTIALVPRSRRRAVLLAAAVALPFTIEIVQLVAVPLGRACQSQDVVDNLTGLVIGLAAGVLVPRVRDRGRRPASSA